MRLLQEEDGQGLAEYALILVFVAMAVIGALKAMGLDLNSSLNNSAATMFP